MCTLHNNINMSNDVFSYKWWKSAVGYIIYPASFYDTNNDGVGDLKGIISKLDYLYELGINLIWICPIFASPMDDNGYDVSDYYKINPLFGSNDDFINLLNKAHEKGIHIVVDFVLNHTSDEHEWFKMAKSSKNNPYQDYYYFRKPRIINGIKCAPNNWKGFFEGSCWEYVADLDLYYLHIFSKKMPDTNWSNKNLRKEYYRIAEHYLSLGVDGFRIDAIAHIAKDTTFEDSILPLDKDGLVLDTSKFSNREEVYDYLHEFNKEVLSKFDALSIGEAGGCLPASESLKYSDAIHGPINMVFNFDTVWQNGAYGSEGKKDSELVVDVINMKQTFLKWYDACYQKAWLPLYWCNHDHPRVLSQYGSVIYRKESAKMLINTLLFMYGTPFIYQGDEIGMSNVNYDSIDDFKDVGNIGYIKDAKKRNVSVETILQNLNRTSRVNARTPMQWNNEKNAGFSSNEPMLKVNSNYTEVNVENQLNDADSILSFFKSAIKLRKTSKVTKEVTIDRFTLLDEYHKDVFAYTHLGVDKLTVISNFRNYETKFTLNGKIDKILLSNYKDLLIKENIITLRPYESIVFYFKTND